MLSGVRDYCKGKDAPLLLYKAETSEHKRQKDLRLEDRGGGGKAVIGGKGLAGMSGSTLRSLMLLDQVGGWLGNKLQRKLV